MIKRTVEALLVALMITMQLAVVDARDMQEVGDAKDEMQNVEPEYTQELIKYSFMVDSKKRAELDYAAAQQSEYNWVLEDECNAYALMMDAKRQTVQQIRDKRLEQEADEDYEDLESALNSLQDELEHATVAMKEAEVVMSSVVAAEPLIVGDRVSSDYYGKQIAISGENRYYLERLVMGEAGNQGFIGAALVAQTIHDNMIKDDCYDVLTIKRTHAYTGELDKEPNDDVRRAVAYIFDNGGIAVRHRLAYFYAPAVVNSSFHESRAFVVEYGQHRFFDDWE